MKLFMLSGYNLDILATIALKLIEPLKKDGPNLKSIVKPALEMLAGNIQRRKPKDEE